MDKKQSVHMLAEELMRLFPQLGRQISIHLRESGEEETTFMQIGVLRQIQENAVTASDVAKLRRVSLQSASVLVQGLVERGWITREPNPNDRRQFLLQITPEGLAKAEATRNQIINYLASFLEALNAEEIAAAQVFLPALGRIVSQGLPNDNPQPVSEEEKTPL